VLKVNGIHFSSSVNPERSRMLIREIDPQVRALLDKINGSRAPKIHELRIAEAREAFKKMNRRSVPAAEAVSVIADYACPSPGGDIPIRVYVPAGQNGGPRPVIAFVHGGGWVFGDLEDYDSLCCALANRSRCRVVSIGYRLAPEHKYPAALEDVERGLRWIFTNAASLSTDASMIGVVADSAGANLAAVVAQSSQPSLPIRAFALIYPAMDLTMSHPSHEELGDGYLLTRLTLQWFLGHYLPDGVDPGAPRISPLYGPAIPGLKHALILTAGFDPLRDEGRAFSDKLRHEGIEVSYECYDSMIHGFMAMGGVVAQADAGISQVASWIKAKLYA
jgi:acetyl esterase